MATNVISKGITIYHLVIQTVEFVSSRLKFWKEVRNNCNEFKVTHQDKSVCRKNCEL